MPKTKFADIYQDLRQKVENGVYAYQKLMPSENELTIAYNCSRNTVRRALRELIELGYVQAIQGKGVRVLYRPAPQSEFRIGGIETFKEAAQRNHLQAKTRVLRIERCMCTAELARKTGFPEGEILWKIYRVRMLDGQPLILDKNLFRADLVPALTKEIAQQSIYEYLEDILGIKIVTSKRRITVERVTEEDRECLELGDYNCVAVITSRTFNDNGIQIEYTISRHHPERFSFEDTAMRYRNQP